MDIEFEDRLAVLGVLIGAFVVIVGLGTLLGLPWTTTQSASTALIQIVGIVATVAIGLILIVVAYADEPGEFVSG